MNVLLFDDEGMDAAAEPDERTAMRLLLTGKPVDAAEALRLGLVNSVVEPDQVLPVARASWRARSGTPHSRPSGRH
ncbi:hypothetical protein [Amycolatopsis thermoflava]|uniref:hypothetical protein n=1 Tax=Amycolatopsis thermoflava TaxID=84480 RepID=UPI001ABFECB6|nr:hypothetical protein [Amycolatopsis thermoflava]